MLPFSSRSEDPPLSSQTTRLDTTPPKSSALPFFVPCSSSSHKLLLNHLESLLLIIPMPHNLLSGTSMGRTKQSHPVIRIARMHGITLARHHLRLTHRTVVFHGFILWKMGGLSILFLLKITQIHNLTHQKHPVRPLPPVCKYRTRIFLGFELPKLPFHPRIMTVPTPIRLLLNELLQIFWTM